MNEIDLFAANRPAVPGYPPAAKASARARLLSAADARPVRRSPRRRGFMLAVPVVAVAVAAAGVLVVVSGSTASPARAEVAAAVARTSGQSFRVAATILGSGGSPIRSEGVFDTRRGLGRLVSHDMPGPTEYRIVGGYEYVKVTHTNYMNDPHYTPYQGKPWIRYAPGTFREDEATPITRAEVDPRQALAYLRDATDVQRQGEASGPGWSGRRYAFTVSPIFTSKVEIGGVLTTQSTPITMTGSVVVDTHGRVRRLDLLKPEGAGSWLHGDMTFSDYGIPVTVTAPPPDQVSDLPG